MGRGGWTSEVLSRLIVGFPYPTTTGTGLIAGPAAMLPPPLNTYLIVGMVWITAGTMNYWGVRYEAAVSDYVAEYGFVTSLGVINQQQYSYYGGPGVNTDFVGGSDVRFLNSGGTYFSPGIGFPVGFLTGNVTFYSDTFIRYSSPGITKSRTVDPDLAIETIDDWDIVFDSLSTLAVPSLRSVTSGAVAGDYSFTANTYGITTSAGTYFSVGVVFTAPASGAVDLDWRGQVLNTVATSQTFISPVVRTGGTIGAGTTVLAADDGRAMICGTTSANPGQTFVGAFCSLTGLTPGSTYNARLEHRVNLNTGRTLLGELRVTPQP